MKNENLLNYNNEFKKTNSISEIKYFYKNFDKRLFKNRVFSICGRIFNKRNMGKSIFINIKDSSDKIQIYISKNDKINKNHNIIEELNIGDIIGVKGNIFLTKTKELSIKTLLLELLSKNKNAFPDKRFGIIDKEICYRKRYLDLITNDESKEIFIIRHKIISCIRIFFTSKNFIEVETPIIQSIPGGADAKPFKTFYNHINSETFLRISPELYLKKLIVGGFEKIFEIGKNFRNEGISTKHSPEFTTIEFYKAYSDYKELIKLTEKLFKFISKSVFGKYKIKYNNNIIDFSKEFKKIDFLDSIIYYGKFNKKDLFNKIFLKKELKKIKIDIDIEFDNVFEMQEKLFENIVEKNLINPTFVMHHPTEISPLSKAIKNNQNYTERFELYIHGKEIANGFSELNDPTEQEKRFLKQIKKNNNEKKIDVNFIDALKYGMPPTAGEGIGLDRLIMIFTNSTSIRDVILFPLMKKDEKKNRI